LNIYNINIIFINIYLIITFYIILILKLVKILSKLSKKISHTEICKHYKIIIMRKTT